MAGLWCGLLGVLVVPSSALAREKVAVMEIKPERVDPALARLLEPIIHSELSTKYEVIGVADIGSMLGFEQQKQMLGCSEDSSCLAEIGGALGVDYILTGNLGQVGNLYLINLKLLDATKARVVRRITETVVGKEEALVMGVQRAVQRLLADGSVAAVSVDAASNVQPTKASEVVVRPVVLSAPGHSNALPWTGVGVGLAAAAVGGFFGMSAVGTASDVRANIKNGSPDGAHLLRDAQLRDSYGLEANLANGLVLGGLACSLVAWLFVDSGSPGGGSEGDAPAVVVAPKFSNDGFVLEGRFR